MARCYTAVLLQDVEASGDPARELPALDARIDATGGFLGGACHGLMHAVGRAYARRHHLTLAALQNVLPRSSDPGCSAGFGHGLIMALGPEIGRTGPKGVLRTCNRLATRMRRYTCIHGLGHAYMRLYDDLLRYALPACRALGGLAAPDCAQGAFHDYWISRSGRDATTKAKGASSSPRLVCGRWSGDFARACWYRVFLELPPAPPVATVADVARVCAGVVGVQRQGCVAAASLTIATSDPLSQVRACRQLAGLDAASCLRSVPVEEIDGHPAAQRELIRACAGVHQPAQRMCYQWIGKALTVVTNGRFGAVCKTLRYPATRARCASGARAFRQPLVTFA